jgi:hypothetical protein
VIEVNSGAGVCQMRIPIVVFHNLSELPIRDLVSSTPYSLGYGPFF